MNEEKAQFEKRKQEHISWALDARTQDSDRAVWDRFELEHEAFPELNFEDVSLATPIFNQKLSAPFFISSMTAGHDSGELINSRLAALSARHQILMGVGSQRKELTHPEARLEWRKIRKQSPAALLMANVGASQLVTHSVDQILSLVDSLEAVALIVHTNPLQEVLQREGTPHFKFVLENLTRVTEKSPVPVVVKEVGFGFSARTLKRLKEVGIAAVDVSGRSGTHWGKIEGLRSQDPVRERAAEAFASWGRSTLEVLQIARELDVPYQIWASGGVRSGLDVAKCVALGADLVGVAQPWLQAALQSEEKLEQLYQQLAFELRTALFCTGSSSVKSLYDRKVGVWRKT